MSSTSSSKTSADAKARMEHDEDIRAENDNLTSLTEGMSLAGGSSRAEKAVSRAAKISR